MKSDDRPTVDTPQFVELPADEVDMALELLEEAMQAGERSLSHEEVRPSTHTLAYKARDAYRVLVREHPDYELTEDGDA